jgi:hypothetical protein
MTDAPKKDPRAVKLGRLFAEAKKRGIDSERLRNEIAPAQLGKRLSKASISEIEKLTQHLGAPVPRTPDPGPRLMSGFKNRYDELGHRDGMASPAQLRMIEGMWMEVSRMTTYVAREKALEGFLKRVVNVQQMEWIENWMVQKIINAISHMKRSKP